jgi:hypothetical protein
VRGTSEHTPLRVGSAASRTSNPAVVFCLGWPKRSTQITSAIQKKKRSAIQKSSARNTRIRGIFGSLPHAEVFFSDTISWEWQVRLVSELKKRCTRSPCLVSLLTYSIPDKIQEQCILSKQASACKQHVLALGLCGWFGWCQRPCATRYNPKECMLVPRALWLATNQLCQLSTHTPPASFHSPAQRTEINKHTMRMPKKTCAQKKFHSAAGRLDGICREFYWFRCADP